MTATVTEIEILEALDFDAEVECDSPNCPNNAEWKVTMKCCGHVFVVCGACLVREEYMFKIMFNPACNVCNAKAKYNPNWDVEPL